MHKTSSRFSLFRGKTPGISPTEKLFACKETKSSADKMRADL